MGRAPVDALSDPDRQLATTLREANGGRILVEERHDGVWVATRSWIGIVRFSGFELRVVPKLSGGNLGVVGMLQYASGIESLKRHESSRMLDAVGDDLLELIAWLFADACEKLLSDGLLSDYVAHEDTLHVLRGRLLILPQVRRQFGRVDPLEVGFDEFETDIPENQILAAALEATRPLVRWPDLQRRIKRLHSVLTEAAGPRPGDPIQLLAELVYTRRNSHYQAAHELAKLLLQRIAIRNLFNQSATSSFAFLLDMNDLFESFVSRLVKDAFEPLGWRVHAQRRDPSIIIDDATGKRYSSIIPDLLLEQRSQVSVSRLPVDAKYKLYDAKKIQEADVYQTFLYAFAYASERRGSKPARAVILYPRSAENGDTSLRVDTHAGRQAARIQAFGIDIELALAAIDKHIVTPESIPGLQRLWVTFEEVIAEAGEVMWLAS
jgi:5-methylcytosine-specific restriction enzyme subunit McrC